MSAPLLLWSRPTGAHRRTAAGWARLTTALATATQASTDLAQQLAEERGQRALADDLMGQIVEHRLAAEARAAACEQALAAERERTARATDVITYLRRQLARPRGESETTEIPMSLVVPLWESAARQDTTAAPASARPSWARAS